MKSIHKKVSFFLTLAFLTSYSPIFAMSFSIGGSPIKTPDGEQINVIGKSRDTRSEACSYAKNGGADYARQARASNFTFGECDCSSRKLEGMELAIAKTGNFKTEITEYICNVDVNIRLK